MLVKFPEGYISGTSGYIVDLGGLGLVPRFEHDSARDQQDLRQQAAK